jgi:septum formation topological specificity factor MinE
MSTSSLLLISKAHLQTVTNFTFAGRTASIFLWLGQLPTLPMTPGTGSSLKMTTTQDGSDPWDWSVDRVVTEICTRNRSWRSAYRMPDFDTFSLEQALRRNNVNGCVLLQDVDETVMKEELGLTLLGPRGFFRDAIATLRRLSAQYQAYQPDQPLETRTSAELESIHDALKVLMERFNVNNPDPNPDLLVPRAQQLLPSLSVETSPGHRSQLLNSAIFPPPPSEETPTGDRHTSGKYLSSETAGDKRRKLGSPDASEEEEPRFDNVAQNEAMLESDKGLPLLVAYPADESGAGFVELKKRKRLAPTLITSSIDPDRNRDLPTAADSVVLNRPQAIVPGVTFIGSDGRKRLMPVLVPQPGKESEIPSNFKDRLPRPNASEHAPSTVGEASSCTSSDGRSLSKRGSTAEVSATRYLGKKKVTVDDLFYKGTAVGKELAVADNTREFYELPKKISTGHRLYVHGVMRRFLRAERQVFERDGKIFSAIRPYPERLVPKFHKPSFTLFYADDGQIHARREEVPSWPEIDSSTVPKQSQDGRDENKVLFNPLGPEIFNSYDNFDPSNLEKYLYLEGGDEILPIYGQSDEENEYDLATWKEIEEEQGELQRPLEHTQKVPLSSKEIDEAIDEGIAELVTQWKEKTRPKREKKAYSLWKKSRKERTKRLQLVAAQKDLRHICERIEKMRKEILDDVWTSMKQVRQQTRIMEVSIFDREDLTFKIKTLELKTAPEKPAPVPSVTGKKGSTKQSTAPSSDGEEGESIGSESEEISSDDGMDDFVIPDEASPTVEEERHELNLADPEDEDGEDATMSDISVLDSPRSVLRTPIHPETSRRRNLSSDVEDYEFLSSPSANDMGTPDIKDEVQTLPKLPAATTNTTSKVVDLTMLSSDDSPAREIVNLITPDKKKTKPVIRLINRNSPFQSSPISISDSNNDTIANADVMPDPENMPPYDDPAAIAKYSYKAWARSFDRERLLIKVFSAMDEVKRASIFAFIPHVSEENLWNNMTQVIRAMIEDSGFVRGMDVSVREIITGFIRLFVMFLDGRYHPSHKMPEHDKLQKVLDNKNPLFAPFYELCGRMEGYFDHSKQVQPSTSKRAIVGDVDEDDEDGEPLSATRRRSRDTT